MQLDAISHLSPSFINEPNTPPLVKRLLDGFRNHLSHTCNRPTLSSSGLPASAVVSVTWCMLSSSVAMFWSDPEMESSLELGEHSQSTFIGEVPYTRIEPLTIEKNVVYNTMASSFWLVLLFTSEKLTVRREKGVSLGISIDPVKHRAQV